MTCTIVHIEPVIEARRVAIACASANYKTLRKRASDVEDEDEQQQEQKQQQEVHRPASCMSDYSPYVWNPQTQRYDLRRLLVAESQHQHQQLNNEDQQYNPAEVAAHRQEPTSSYPAPSYPQLQEPWNPWAYLDIENQRPYTPTQPAVAGAGSTLPDLPIQYGQYRAPAHQVDSSSTPYDYQDRNIPSYYSTGSAAPSNSYQQGPSYHNHEYHPTATYSGWHSTTQTFLPQESSSNSHTLPPLPVSHPINRGQAGSTSVTGSASIYTSNNPTSSFTSNNPPANTRTAYQASPNPQSPPAFQSYDLSYTNSHSPEALLRPPTSTSELTSGQLAPPTSTSQKLLEWIAFLDLWQVFIRNSERVLSEQAARGELPGFVPQTMAQPAPTFASCEDLAAGFTRSYQRITVDRLKLLIRGINSVPGLPVSHVKASGLKQELINRIVDVLRSLKNTQSSAYFPVAKLIGEAQGIVYEASGASGTTASASAAAGAGASSSSYAPPPASSAAGPSYARQYSSATYTDIVPAASTSAPSIAYGSDYAVRPAQFGLSRSPARAGTGASASPYGNAGVASSSNAYNYNTRPYGNSPNPQYRQAGAPPAAASTSTSSSHLQGHRAGGGPSSTGGYGSALSNQIPTSLPVPLAPKSAIPGQPAIPINFKSSPFFKVISAVSTIVTLPRPGHQNERATATAHLHLTEDQRQKLLAAREDPKAPQYQLRLYCTSNEFYHPHAVQYGSVARQPLPIEFPLSSEAKMNDSAVVANLRGIKKKPGTAPPAHVSSAKVGNPSRTAPSSTTPNAPVGSWALKLNSTRDTNKVDLVYMNTEKTYFMIVYFVEAFSVSQVVEKIKKEKFRQKEDVLRSIHRAAEDPDIQATSSTITLKDPLTFTALNTPIRSIHCVHLQCFDAFCFLSMMESTPDWKCPVCNRALQSTSAEELVHDGFFQDIQDSLPKNSGIESVIVEVDGTWHTEDFKFGNSKKALEYKERMKNGLTVNNLAQLENGGHNGVNGMNGAGNAPSRASSVLIGKDGTPMDVKPDIGGGGGLAVPNGISRGNSKSKTPAAIIELDDDDDDDNPYGNDDTPPPPPRPIAGFGAQRHRLTSTSTVNGAHGANGAGARTAGKVIDLTLSDSDDDNDNDGASSSIVGMGSRAPSGALRTPNRGLATSTSTTTDYRNRNGGYTPPPRSTGVSQGTTTAPSSAATVNGNNNNNNQSAAPSNGNVVAGVKRRQDSEAAYEELWAMEDGVDRDRDRDTDDRRPSQVPRYS